MRRHRARTRTRSPARRTATRRSGAQPGSVVGPATERVNTPPPTRPTRRGAEPLTEGGEFKKKAGGRPFGSGGGCWQLMRGCWRGVQHRTIFEILDLHIEFSTSEKLFSSRLHICKEPPPIVFWSPCFCPRSTSEARANVWIKARCTGWRVGRLSECSTAARLSRPTAPHQQRTQSLPTNQGRQRHVCRAR